MLSTTAIDEQAAEEHLRLAYRMVGCEPPQIRWFDAPIPFALSHFPTNLLGKIRKMGRINLSSSGWEYVEASTQVTIGRSMGWYHLPPIWPFTESSKRYQMAMNVWKRDGAENPITEGVWHSVEEHVSARVEHSLSGLMRQVERGVWSNFPTGEDRIWRNMDEMMQRSLVGGVNACANAYGAQRWLALVHFLHENCVPDGLIHLARLNEMVSAYRLGTEEAWLVRKPIQLERDESNEGGFYGQYSDGWRFGSIERCKP